MNNRTLEDTSEVRMVGLTSVAVIKADSGGAVLHCAGRFLALGGSSVFGGNNFVGKR